MMPQHHLPADIERTSMKIIAGELAQRGLDIPPENAPVVKRVIHTTADFDYAQTLHFTPGAVLAVGNAPTALLTIAEKIENGLRPALVIGVPVGFVNVVESKERLFAVCESHGVPAIVAMGRKGGSNVAAAICNALIYSAAEMLDPTARGWK